MKNKNTKNIKVIVDKNIKVIVDIDILLKDKLEIKRTFLLNFMLILFLFLKAILILLIFLIR